MVFIHNLNHPTIPPLSVVYCDSFWTRFRGLMFKNSLAAQEGLLLVEKKDSRIDSAIHMLFMKFDIAAVWINSKKIVVDVKIARKGQWIIVPQQPACCVLETHTDQFTNFHIGDTIDFKHA